MKNDQKDPRTEEEIEQYNKWLGNKLFEAAELANKQTMERYQNLESKELSKYFREQREKALDGQFWDFAEVRLF